MGLFAGAVPASPEFLNDKVSIWGDFAPQDSSWKGVSVVILFVSGMARCCAHESNRNLEMPYLVYDYPTQ